MSAANRKGVVREALDRYYTPDACALACVRALPGNRSWPRLIVEPSVGAGSFARAARQEYLDPWILGVDLDPDATGFGACNERIVGDWLQTPRHVFERYATVLVVGNPPYSMAEEHIRFAIDATGNRGMVGMLLRLNFLGGQKRYASFWRNNPPNIVHVLSRRPSFTGGGSDATEYAFFVWDRAVPASRTELTWLEW